jgi:hypothetical protein
MAIGMEVCHLQKIGQIMKKEGMLFVTKTDALKIARWQEKITSRLEILKRGRVKIVLVN